jgi:hypothetical protein
MLKCFKAFLILYLPDAAESDMGAETVEIEPGRFEKLRMCIQALVFSLGKEDLRRLAEVADRTYGNRFFQRLEPLQSFDDRYSVGKVSQKGPGQMEVLFVDPFTFKYRQKVFLEVSVPVQCYRGSDKKSHTEVYNNSIGGFG